MQTTIKHLFIYPVKSLMGVRVSKLNFTATGVEHDRRYLLVDQANKMMTQRSHAILSQFKLTRLTDAWQVTSPQGQTLEIPDALTGTSMVETSVWKTPLKCFEKSVGISAWFSQQLKAPVRLVELDKAYPRSKHVDGMTAPLAFADGYPLLVCNEQSLAQLNAQLPEPIGMERFRPNIVIDLPVDREFELRGLAQLEEGKIHFSEACVRCNVPAINPKTSEFNRELHQQLNVELRKNGKVVFGVNAVSEGVQQVNEGESFSCF